METAFPKRGTNSIAIQSKLNAMVGRVEKPPTKNELENIATHLYNGFYCFEAITERNLDDGICGICGIIGEVYFGDGNVKNCICKIDYSIESYKVPVDSSTMCSTSLEEFLNNSKKRWVECTTYTRTEKLQTHYCDIPPVIAPSMRGEIVFNTEANKKSTFIKQHGHPKESDPALLHYNICNENIDMSKIDKFDHDSLKILCQSCGISTSKKSMVS